jgi:acyl carrier protein
MSNIQEEIKKLFSIMFRKDVLLDDNFIDLGGDSIILEKLIIEIKRRFNVSITSIDIINSESIKEISMMIHDNIIKQ